MCSTDVCNTNKPATVPKKPSPIISSFSRWPRKLLINKICVAAQKMLKTKQQTFMKWIARFYYFRHLYSAGSAVLCAHNNCMSCPSIWATLSLLLSLIYGSFQLFLHSDQPLSEGEIIPFSGVCQSGEAALSTPEAVVASRATDRLLWCATDDDQRQHHHAEHHFQRPTSANSFVYFASSAATSRWRICMSVIAAFASFSSLAFLSLGFVGNGVITGND